MIRTIMPFREILPTERRKGKPMVIDKTTGKGCAWSIVSKTVTKELIAEGIVGKLISREPLKKNSSALRVVDHGEPYKYVISQRAGDSAEEPLWIPSFVDTE